MISYKITAIIEGLNMIICIGEIVWDIFATGKALGGAPLNVAYHLNSFGHKVKLISRVGHDDYGRTALKKIAALGLSTDAIQQDADHQTGKVLIQLNDNKEPSFEILFPAAWDYIDRNEVIGPDKSYHLVLGTLAQRSPLSRSTICSLCASADTIFYDVNLRTPFTTKELVIDTLFHANVVKMNEDELASISRWAELTLGNLDEMARSVADSFNLEVLAITLGAAGAILVTPDMIYKHAGFPVQVTDTVGSGDAFFAKLIDGILKKETLQDCLVQSNRRGAYVASQPGATPNMTAFQADTSKDNNK
jgi:fructokinase